MSPEIEKLLEKLTDMLAPIRVTAGRLGKDDAIFEEVSNAVLISKRPKIAPEAYACVLYAGVAPSIIDKYEEIQFSHRPHHVYIPRLYRTILERLNGANIFEMSLYGLPYSMVQDPPLLNRSIRQPLDIATANVYWRVPYKVSEDRFHFGGGSYSFTENVGYFLDKNGAVEAYLKAGKLVGAWPGIQQFLTDEIARTEAAYAEYERSMEENRKSAAVKAKGTKFKRRFP